MRECVPERDFQREIFREGSRERGTQRETCPYGGGARLGKRWIGSRTS